ncbi:MAG TPA: hypothetical protein VE913_07850 [Longimicrobium sp.]|nr:hypothetical protein [Longimicrobium sp.]
MTELNPKPQPVDEWQAFLDRAKAAGITITPSDSMPYDPHPEPTDTGGVTLSDAVIEDRYDYREWE